MALTKASGTILASTSVSAGSTSTGSSVDLTAIYGGEFLWKITNGGSAPTTPPTMKIQVSPDGTNWYDKYYVSGDTTASSVNSGSYPCPVGVMYARSVCTGGATNGSTFECLMEQVTAV